MPLNLSRRVKNFIVRDGPIVSVNPTRKKISPIARRVESNKKITPVNSRMKPRAKSPVPIFVLSLTILSLVNTSSANQLGSIGAPR
mmetsp:Transcript_14132/g.28174  ORF Transcript_14132/g.28174 Transcript_14132/m.28174 type:complete len:86 (+) Transcript_14132:294-551(+)